MDLEDALLTALGHAFRRNLINITDLANIMQAATKDSLHELCQADLQAIQAEAAEMLDAVDDIVEFARLSGLSRQIDSLPVQTILDSAIPILQRKVVAANRTLVAHFDLSDMYLQGNIKELEDAFVRAVSIILRLSDKSTIYFDAKIDDIALIIRIHDLIDSRIMPVVAIDVVPTKAANPSTLIDLLYCIRAARGYHGQFEWFSTITAGESVILQFWLP